jgi:hypothetical protein
VYFQINAIPRLYPIVLKLGYGWGLARTWGYREFHVFEFSGQISQINTVETGKGKELVCSAQIKAVPTNRFCALREDRP